MRTFRTASAAVAALAGGIIWFAWRERLWGGGASGSGMASGLSDRLYMMILVLIGVLLGLLFYVLREVRRIRQRKFDLDKLSLVADKTDHVVMILNQAGKIDWVNEGFSKVTGYNRADAVGQDPGPLLLGDRASGRNLHILQEGMKQRKHASVELSCTSKHGGTYWLSLTLHPVASQHGRIVHMVGLGSNITARKKAEDALARMSRWYELMLIAMREGICGVDLNGVITFINPAVARITGWKAGELIGKPISNLMHQLQVSAMPDTEYDQFVAVAFKDNTILMGDADYFRRKDGSLFPVDYNSTPVREEDQLVGFVVVFRDITERRQAEANRARQARQFALRAEIGFCLAMSDTLKSFLELSAQALVKHLDGALARIWMHNPDEEMLELTASAGLSNRIDGTESRIPMGAFRVGRIARNGVPELSNKLGTEAEEVDEEWLRQEQLVSFVGLPLVVENRLVAVMVLYGRKLLPEDTLDLLGAVTDAIGQGLVRKRAEEKVAEQAALLDKSKDAILVIDLSNCCQYWNRSAETLYGWPAREVLGKRVDQLIYADPSQFTRAKNEVVAKGEWKEESKQITRDNQSVTVESHWTLVQDKKGQPKSILLVNTNLTDKKEMESRFLRAQRMDSLGTLAGGIAHDLNNILSPILMSVEVLKERFNDPQSHRLLSLVESSAKRGADMVKQVLTFSRGVDSERVLLQTRHLLKEVGRIVTETFPKTIQLRMVMPENLWTIKGDATQLHQVLINLAVNARDAMSQGGSLTLAAENVVLEKCPVPDVTHFQPGFYVLIKVTDTGVGIPKESLCRIFEPFFTTKEKDRGTGLGLSTVLGIVKSHGGFVQVDTEVNRGSEFRVYLPAYETVTQQSQAASPVRLPSGSGEWILAVDDEASVLTMTKEMLETYGYHVLTARDGTEAVALYSQHQDKIKGVLTDMLMPDMDGPTTIRILKKLDPSVRIIASSGLVDANKAKDAIGLEHIDFLMKPYTAETLLGAVHQALHPSSASSETKIAA
jgi:two-component system cell cycle sensor histidine kinase/response regulator CckA